MTKERNHVTCRATRVDDWWAVGIDDLPGAHTQARRLDKVEAAVTDMLALLVDQEPESFDVTISVELSGAEQDALDRLAEARERYERAKAGVADAQRAAAALLVGPHGLTVRDAGVIMGVSYQRIAWLTGRAG